MNPFPDDDADGVTVDLCARVRDLADVAESFNIIANSRDVCAATVYSREGEGKISTFETRNGEFTDVETGTTRMSVGRAAAGPLSGAQPQQCFVATCSASPGSRPSPVDGAPLTES